MKSVLIYIFCLSIFFISSCSQDPNKITIKGSIANPVSDELVFNFTDTSYEARVDANGDFKITLNQDSAQYVTLLHGERTRMFIKPGDNIEIHFDTKEFDETMTYNNSPESSFLAYKLISAEEKDFYGKSLYLADKVSYELELENYKTNLMQRLDRFENGYFKSTEEKSIKASVESYLINAQKILGDRLVRVPYSDDMPDLINVMDVFCLPSHREGMPRSIIEAMMMGKPVIATNIRGSREEVINNITGLLVPVNNAKELYKAFETLILNKKFTLKLGKNGRTRAIEHFSEIKIVEKQLYLIKKFYRLKKIYEKSI